MQITAGAENLTELAKDGQLITVPGFQRNYSWKKSEVEQFLLDIYECAETGEAHFWGPIVVLKESAEPNQIQIIDGQQRLTTAFMFIAVLRDTAVQLLDEIMDEDTDNAFNLRVPLNHFLFKNPNGTEPKFESNILIRDIFWNYIYKQPPRKSMIKNECDDHSWNQTAQLRAAYKIINNSLKKKLEGDIGAEKDFIHKIFKALTANFQIFTLELSNEDDAYTLFESLNDRGLRLNPSDLLKTVTLKKIKEDGNLDMNKVLADWDKIDQNLGTAELTKFFRHYLLTKYKEKVQSKKIFIKFKDQIEKLNPNGAEKNLNFLVESSVLYANLVKPSVKTKSSNGADSELHESFRRMNSYSETHRIFLLGMLGLGLEKKSQLLLTRSIEYLSFRWIAAGKNAQELETLYQDHFHELKDDSGDDGVRKISKKLIKAAPNNDELINIAKTGPEALCRYVLRRIAVLSGGYIDSNAELEHLAPKNPNKESNWYEAVGREKNDEGGKSYSDYLDNWGNLTLLEQSLNSSIGNSVWAVKINGTDQYEGISASTYKLNETIKSLDAWTSKTIENREKWIQNATYKLVGTDWVETGNAPVEMWDYQE